MTAPNFAHAPTQAAVYAALSTAPFGGLTIREMMAALGHSYSAIFNALRKLRQRARAERDPAGPYWRLIAAKTTTGPDPWPDRPMPLEKGVTPDDLAWMRAQRRRAIARAQRLKAWQIINHEAR